MRRLLLLAALSMVATLVFAPSVMAQDPSAYNCDDFDTQEEAQQFLLPGDPYILDADDDGQACDELPSGGSTATPTESSDDTASPTPSPTASPTASPTSSPTASAAPAAQYQYGSALPGTGGVSPSALLAIIPAILLVGGGLLSARLIRRR